MALTFINLLYFLGVAAPPPGFREPNFGFAVISAIRLQSHNAGCTFRYPVYYTNPEGTEIRTKYRISELKPKNINSLHYRFGSNHLYIGDALVKVLEHIEEQCGIDIAELLKQKKSKK